MHSRWTRRNFLAAGAAATAGALVSTPKSLQAQQPTGRRVLHIIGYSHIDAAWLWPWRDGSNLALTTMKSALDRMRETPGFRYSHSSTVHYQWLQAASPEMFQEVKQRIAEGRWEVVGGWPVEPDCNLPSTESFARHELYGKRYCEQVLDAHVDIGFNPDSFGHAAGLPTILRAAGYNSYVFMRPREMEANLPRLFWWEGPDGSRVLTLHIWNSYDMDASQIPSALDHVFAPGFDHGAFILGVGDHGGAVTKVQIAQVEAMRSDPALPELRWSTVREFLDAVFASPAMAHLPVVRGGLQHHSRGCYSANGNEKYQNRRAERALKTSESIAALASASSAVEYPRQDFANAWQQVLFNQFHDLLAGTALYGDYEDARDGFGLACQLANSRKIEHLEVMAKQVDMHDVPEGAVFVYNPLPWPRKVLLQYMPSGYGIDPVTHLIAPDGAIAPLQQRPSPSMTNFYPRLAALLALPAFGYRVYNAARGTFPMPSAAKFTAQFDISRSSFGTTSLKSKEGVELLAAPLGLVVIKDKSDTWGHDVERFDKEIGRPEFLSAEIAEDGPVVRLVRQHLRWANSRITVEIAEFAGVEALELRFVIDWREHEQILKLEIPTALTQPRSFAKVAGAIEERKPTGGEEPGQDWIALEGVAGGHRHVIALLNAQTYSYDCKDARLRTVLIRSAPYARHQPNPVDDNGVNAWQDQGRQERCFWLVRRSGEVMEQDLDRLADELQSPAEYVIDSRHAGTRPKEQSFLEVTPANVSVLSVKRAEAGDALVIRLQERSGRRTTAQILSNVLGIRQSISLMPWQIQTIRFERGTSEGRIVSVLEI